MASSVDKPVSHGPSEIPVEIAIFLNADGSVTFADLEEHVIAIAQALNPDCELACDLTPASATALVEHDQP